MTAKNFAEQHPWQNDIVSELRLPDTLRSRVHFAEGLADNV